MSNPVINPHAAIKRELIHIAVPKLISGILNLIIQYSAPLKPVMYSQGHRCGFCHLWFIERVDRKQGETRYTNSILIHNSRRQRHILCIGCFDMYYKRAEGYVSESVVCVLCRGHAATFNPQYIVSTQHPTLITNRQAVGEYLPPWADINEPPLEIIDDEPPPLEDVDYP